MSQGKSKWWFVCCGIGARNQGFRVRDWKEGPGRANLIVGAAGEKAQEGEYL